MSSVSKAAYATFPDLSTLIQTYVQIISRIFWPVTTVTIFATIIVYAWSKGHHVVLTNSVVPLLSVVVSILAPSQLVS